MMTPQRTITEAEVSKYDFTLYHQAIELAKKQYRSEQRAGNFQAHENFISKCNAAYTRLMNSKDTVKAYPPPPAAAVHEAIRQRAAGDSADNEQEQTSWQQMKMDKSTQ